MPASERDETTQKDALRRHNDATAQKPSGGFRNYTASGVLAGFFVAPLGLISFPEFLD
jgi:hypothetical protein